MKHAPNKPTPEQLDRLMRHNRPINDASGHQIYPDGKCWCKPDIEIDPITGNKVVIHRNIKEEGN